MPFQIRLKICHKLLEKVKELVNNNIYVHDLSAFNQVHVFNKNGANVLLSLLSFKPIIIDLDGKSTTYTENSNQYFEKLTSCSVTTLIISILSGEIINELLQQEDIDSIYEIFNQLGILSYFDKYYDCSLIIDEAEEILRRIKKH